MTKSITSLSRLSRALSAVLIIGYVLTWSRLARRTLGLVPGLAIPFRLWTFVTYAYLPGSLFSLLATLPLATYLTHILEPIQGHKGLALIVVVTVAVSGVATWFTTWLFYVISSMVSTSAAESMINVLYTPICGFYAGAVGLLVGFKQAVPGEVTLGSVKVRTATLPVAYVLAVCLGQLTWGRVANCMIAVYGFVVSWMWLRYFHPGAAPGLVGDPSDQFKMLVFMPEVLQRHPKINTFSDQCDAVMQRWAAQAKDFRAMIDLLKRGRSGTWGADGVAAGTAGAAPAVREEDATRRRERGMKSLEERLGATAEEEDELV